MDAEEVTPRVATVVPEWLRVTANTSPAVTTTHVAKTTMIVRLRFTVGNRRERALRHLIPERPKTSDCWAAGGGVGIGHNAGGSWLLIQE